MKLKKREITLNEADSVKDLFFLDRALADRYKEGLAFAERKEVANLCQAFAQKTQEEKETLYKLWHSVKAAQP